MPGSPDSLSILLLTRYNRLGASSRLRYLDFVPKLAAQGIGVDVSPFFDDLYLRRLYAGERTGIGSILGAFARRIGALLRAGRYDAVWIEKEALPYLPGALERLLLGSVPIVVDFDDAWHLRYRRTDPYSRWFLRNKLERVARGASVVLAGSPYLEEWARAAGARKVVRLPTTIDLARYEAKALNREEQALAAGAGAALPRQAIRPPSFPHPSGNPAGPRPFTIGWMGSPTTAPFVAPLAPALSALQAEPGKPSRVRLVGAGTFRLEDAAAEVLPWSEASEADMLAGFDVGVMPLPDDEWSRGKCAYKLIQYMAAGLPVVASPVGMNTEVVRPGENGFLASTAEEWAAALRTLRDDPALRARMGRQSRRMAEEMYTHDAALPVLAEALRFAAAQRSRPGAAQA